MSRPVEYQIINGIIWRKCSPCGRFLDSSHFYRDKGRPEGIGYICKECQKKYIEDNAERLKLYRQNHKEERKEYNRKVHHKYKDKRAEYNAKYRAIHSDRVKESKQKYLSTEQGKLKRALKEQRRRHKIKYTDNTLVSEQWHEILQHQNNMCAGCGTKFTHTKKATIDHIFPLNLGGGLTKDNVQALCLSCNSSKCDRLDWVHPCRMEYI